MVLIHVLLVEYTLNYSYPMHSLNLRTTIHFIHLDNEEADILRVLFLCVHELFLWCFASKGCSCYSNRFKIRQTFSYLKTFSEHFSMNFSVWCRSGLHPNMIKKWIFALTRLTYLVVFDLHLQLHKYCSKNRCGHCMTCSYILWLWKLGLAGMQL